MNSQTGYRVGDEHPAAIPDADLAQHIRAELAMAAALDAAAREHRCQAGRLLAGLRTVNPVSWCRCVDLDQRSAELLLELGAGAKPAGHPR